MQVLYTSSPLIYIFDNGGGNQTNNLQFSAFVIFIIKTFPLCILDI